jgi:hypothetical protein
VSCTPRYPHLLETVLNHTRGDIESVRRQTHHGGTDNFILQRVAVERNPDSPPPEAYDVLYDPETHRQLIAALPQTSSPSQEMDEYGNIIGESDESESRTEDQSDSASLPLSQQWTGLGCVGLQHNHIPSRPEQSHLASLPRAPQQWTGRIDSVDSAGWPILPHNRIPVSSSPEISASPEPEQSSSGRHHYLDSFGNPVSFSNPVRS